MGSSRLPGKILLDIAGKPMLQRVVERARQARWIDGVAVATTVDPADDQVADFCAQQGYPCFRGSVHDVLDRYYQAAQALEAKTIIRLTGDCPLVDPRIIDQTILAFRGLHPQTGQLMADAPFDFACTRLPPPWRRTYPIGLDVEICSFTALERAWKEGAQPYHREHVMPYLYEECRSRHYTLTIGQELPGELRRLPTAPLTTSEAFQVVILNHFPDYGQQRWTVDTPADLEFLRQVLARLPDPDTFQWYDILNLLEREPHLVQINAETYHKDYREVDAQQKPAHSEKPAQANFRSRQ